MIKIEKEKIEGFEDAIRGMRNPYNSWDKSDSRYVYCHDPNVDNGAWHYEYKIGKNDLDLMKILAQGGSDHAKYRRMIAVYADITAPLYFWKEFDTYKVGTVANSCSTMHTIGDKEFTLFDFSIEHLNTGNSLFFNDIVINLNHTRNCYIYAVNQEDKKEFWWQMIQLLPSSYNQKRTVMLNYEVLSNMWKGRHNHKLDEWRIFCDWMKTLPYAEGIIFEEVPETW